MDCFVLRFNPFGGGGGDLQGTGYPECCGGRERGGIGTDWQQLNEIQTTVYLVLLLNSSTAAPDSSKDRKKRQIFNLRVLLL